MLTSSQVAQKWATNTQNAQAALKAGVMAVTTAPTAIAAQRADKYLAGVNAAVSSGRYQAALNSVSLQDWQQAMNTKASARIGPGVTAAVPKMQSFMDKWLPYEAAGSATVAGMPKTTLADSQARAAFMIQYNAAFSKRLVGS
jgi:hypothetical protein